MATTTNGHDHDGKDVEELKLSAAKDHIQVSHLKATPYLMRCWKD